MPLNIFAGLTLSLMALAFTYTVDQAAMDKQQSHYCEMVELHQSSGGELGWPDFKETYEESCNAN